MPAQSNVFPAFLKLETDPGNRAVFSAFQSDVTQAVEGAQRQFTASFGQIKNIVSDALTLPRNAFGSLDLNVGKLKEAAENARAQAVGLREVATAAQRAATANRDNSENTRLYVQAARAAALEAEKNARSLEETARAHDRLQVELNQTKSATDRIVQASSAGTTANHQLANSSRAVRQASLQAGQQFQDIAISIYSGQRASVVFAQQLPQLAFAFTGLTDSANKTQRKIGEIATYLSGPWGALIGIGVGVLGTLIAEMALAGDSSDDLGKKVKSLTERIQDQNDALRQNLQLQAQKRQADLAEAQSLGREALQDRGKLQKQLDTALRNLATLKNLQKTPGAGGGGGVNANILLEQDNIRSLQAQLAKLNADIDRTGQNTRLAQAAIIQNINKGKLDPAIAETTRYETAQAKLNEEFAKGAIQREEYARRELDLLKVHKANTAAIQAQASAQRSASSALAKDIPTAAQLSRLLREEFPGTRITSTTGGKHVKGSHHYQNRAVDFVPAGGVNSVTKAQVRQALEARGVTIDELLGPGDKGHSDHFHVSVTKGKVALQGFLDAEKDAAKAAADLERNLEFIESRYGKVANAADNYYEALDKIAKLVEAGKLTGDQALEYQSAAALKFYDDEQADLERSLRAAFERVSPAFREAIERPLVDVPQVIQDALDKEDLRVRVKAELEDRGLDAIEGLFGRDIAIILDKARSAGKTDGSTGGFLESFGKGNKATEQEFANFLAKSLDKVFSKLSKNLSETLGAAAFAIKFGAETGGDIAGIGKSLGLKTSKLGGQIGGAIGSAIAGPLGAIVGGTLGSVVGGLFKSTKSGSATIGGSGGSLRVSSLTGNSGKFRQASGESADAAISTVERIAEQLGGIVNAANGSVSIGVRDGKYRVDTTGQGITKTKKGALDFGDDAAAAVKAATLDLIKDGVIEGLRASTQRLLQNGKDLESAIDKATRFESVFTELKAYSDPVGAALDTLDKQFRSLQRTFEEAGASTEEYASLEKLYGIKRSEAIKEATDAVVGSLRSLLADLGVNNDARSLRERRSLAQAAFNPLAARVAQGDITAYDDFAEAARTLLDVQRQIFGSGGEYFSLLDEVTRLTSAAVAGQDGITAISVNRDSPFTSTGAVNDTAANQTLAINAMNDNLGNILTTQFGITNANLRLVIEGYQAAATRQGLTLTGTGNF